MGAKGKFYAPSFIYLYQGADTSELNVKEMIPFLREYYPAAHVDMREDFIKYWIQRGCAEGEEYQRIAMKFAQARVHDPEKQNVQREPLPGEVDFELRFLTAGSQKPVGMLYDGFRMGTIYAELLACDEEDLDHCHIIVTNQLIGTWGRNDDRYHIRASVYNFPSFVSTSGIVEGPARPRDYYLGRRLGLGEAKLEEAFAGKYIGYGDVRLPEVTKGYLLQALFYHVTGDPFCTDRDCRLFNAHWQEEVIHAQLRPGADLCSELRQMLEGFSYRPA
jgi:hypothetical protein